MKSKLYLLVVTAGILSLATFSCGESGKRDVSEPRGESTVKRDYAKEMTSVKNVVSVGMSVDRYIQDNPRIGAPRVDDIETLINVLMENVPHVEREMAKDGWGNDLVYWVESGGLGRLFSVTSLGADGAPGPEVEPNAQGERIISHPDQDIVYQSGRLIQHPEGASMQ